MIMGLTRRELLLGGASLGVAATLSGCAGLTRPAGEQSTSGSGGGGGPATLTFVNWSGDTEKAAFDALIKAFTEANPDITIKTDTVPYDSIQTNLDSRFQSGNPPDLFRVSHIDIGQYTSQDVLLDVSGTFDQARIDEFEPALWRLAALVQDRLRRRPGPGLRRCARRGDLPAHAGLHHRAVA
jgi:multiple sugar transport system substrate-binding protein